MIRKLQKRFIRIAVLVLTAAMVIVVAIVNTANLISVRNELQGTLRLLSESRLPSLPEGVPFSEDAGNTGETDSADGTANLKESLKDASKESAKTTRETGNARNSGNSGSVSSSDDSDEAGEPEGFFWPGLPFDERNRHSRNMMNESSWFTVHFTSEGEARNKNLTRTADMDEETAETLAREALKSGRDAGWIQDYCFLIRDEGSRGQTVVMLNCETRMTAVRNLALISAIACAGGILASWLLVKLFSRKAVEPTIRNMEQQKQFITNASHELKTPLTVISTNMELLKMENPDNPWIRSTQKQTGALRHLVDELVYLSRMEEENPALTMETLNTGSMLREAAEPFQTMAEFNGREMEVLTEDGLRMTGDRPSIQRLMSTLLDNAVKYTPEGGSILAEAVSEGKYALIRVSNTVETPMTKEQCAQLFNRFYRADESRNKAKQSGFGIGLAIAAAIAEKHGGSMDAKMEEEKLVISARIPKATKDASLRPE